MLSKSIGRSRRLLAALAAGTACLSTLATTAVAGPGDELIFIPGESMPPSGSNPGVEKFKKLFEFSSADVMENFNIPRFDTQGGARVLDDVTFSVKVSARYDVNQATNKRLEPIWVFPLMTRQITFESASGFLPFDPNLVEPFQFGMTPDLADFTGFIYTPCVDTRAMLNPNQLSQVVLPSGNQLLDLYLDENAPFQQVTTVPFRLAAIEPGNPGQTSNKWEGSVRTGSVPIPNTDLFNGSPLPPAMDWQDTGMGGPNPIPLHISWMGGGFIQPGDTDFQFFTEFNNPGCPNNLGLSNANLDFNRQFLSFVSVEVEVCYFWRFGGPDLNLDKECTDSLFNETTGLYEAINYTLTIGNNGPVDATLTEFPAGSGNFVNGVIVTDNIENLDNPGILNNVTLIAGSVRLDGVQMTFNAGGCNVLQPGQYFFNEANDTLCANVGTVPEGAGAGMVPPRVVTYSVRPLAAGNLVNSANLPTLFEIDDGAGGLDQVPDPNPEDNSDDCASEVRSVDLEVEIVCVPNVNPQIIKTGDTTGFNIRVTNLTNINSNKFPAENVQLTISVAPNNIVGFQSITGLPMGGSCATPMVGTPIGVIVCNLGTINPGQTIGNIQLNVIGLIPGTVTATAVVDALAANSPDPVSANNTDTSCQVQVRCPIPDLSLVKTIVNPNPGVPPQYMPGDNVSFNLQISNAPGAQRADGIVVMDIFDTRLDVVGPIVISGGGATGNCMVAQEGVSSKKITCTLNPAYSLPPGGSFNINYTLNIPSNFSFGVPNPTCFAAITNPPTIPPCVQLINSAMVTSTCQGVVQDSAMATSVFQVCPPVTNVTLVKDVSPTNLKPGDSATYTIHITNQGPAIARNVLLRDVLPRDAANNPVQWQAGSVIFNPALPGANCLPTMGGGTILCSLGDLAPGQMVSISYSVIVPETWVFVNPLLAEDLVNVATVCTTTFETNYNDNEDDAVIRVTPNSADLRVIKECDGRAEFGADGGMIAYRIVVTNNGPNHADGVEVVDTLPPGFDLLPVIDQPAVVSGGMGTCSMIMPGNPGFTCNLGPIAPGGSIEIRFKLTAPDESGVYRNTVTVSLLPGPGSLVTDPVLSNNSDFCETTIQICPPDYLFWDNGDFDVNTTTVGGFPSQVDTQLEPRAADDFYLPMCAFYRFEYFEITILTNSVDPTGVLEIYSDCNSKPGELLFTIPAPTTKTNTGVQFNNETAWILRYEDFDCWLRGKNRYWVSFGGIKVNVSDVYYFATTPGSSCTDAMILGMQAHLLRYNFEGEPFWCPTEGMLTGPHGNPVCTPTQEGKTDLAFKFCAEPCDIIWDNGKHVEDCDNDSIPDIQEAIAAGINVAQPRFRVADDFQLAPCSNYSICIIELCIATTRDTCQNMFFEIYETDPDTCLPALSPTWIFSPQNGVVPDTMVGFKEMLKKTIIIEKNGQPITLNVFTIQYEFPKVINPDAQPGEDPFMPLMLAGGQRYWIAPYDAGAGAASNFSIPCFGRRCDLACKIQLDQAQALLMPFDHWAGVSHIISAHQGTTGTSNAETKRDLAFAVAGKRKELPRTPADNSNCNLPDVDGDGVVTISDYFAFLTAFFSQI